MGVRPKDTVKPKVGRRVYYLQKVTKTPRIVPKAVSPQTAKIGEVLSCGMWCKELTHWKRPWCWERLKAGGEGDDRGWDGWIASLKGWIWIWVGSRSWWWTGKPGLLQSIGSQRVRHDWVTELNMHNHEGAWAEENSAWDWDKGPQNPSLSWLKSVGSASSFHPPLGWRP